MKKFLNWRVLLTLTMPLLPSVVEAATGIDARGAQIHMKLVGIGKWIIVGKGTVDIIQNVLNGDTDTAKSKFMGYLLMFALLLALPWGLNEVEALFR